MRGKKFDQICSKNTKKAITPREILKFFRESMLPDPLESFFLNLLQINSAEKTYAHRLKDFTIWCPP